MVGDVPFTIGGMSAPPPRPQISCKEKRRQNVQLFHQLKHFLAEPKRRYLIATFPFFPLNCVQQGENCNPDVRNLSSSEGITQVACSTLH